MNRHNDDFNRFGQLTGCSEQLKKVRGHRIKIKIDGNRGDSPRCAAQMDNGIELCDNVFRPDRPSFADNEFHVRVFEIGEPVKNFMKRSVGNTGCGSGNDHGSTPCRMKAANKSSDKKAFRFVNCDDFGHSSILNCLVQGGFCAARPLPHR